MPSYLSYLKQVVVYDAKDDDIESWITVRGKHIPIMKGQSKGDAVKSFFEKKGGEESKKSGGSPKAEVKKSGATNIEGFKGKIKSQLGKKIQALSEKRKKKTPDFRDFEEEVDTEIVGMYAEYVKALKPALEEKFGVKIKKGDFGENTDSPFDYRESIAKHFGAYSSPNDVLRILKKEALTQLADHNKEAWNKIGEQGSEPKNFTDWLKWSKERFAKLDKKQKQRHEMIKFDLARHSWPDTKWLEILADDENPDIRAGVAENRHTPVEVLKKLAKDKELSVRAGVAFNINCPRSLEKELRQDKEKWENRWD